jgi:VacB/RNase II family 3'-5' exoribonuclease
MHDSNPTHLDLQATAKQIMQEHGFQPDFPAEVSAQLASLNAQPSTPSSPDVRDMRNLLWSSIDNDTSRDLDQIEVAERGSNGEVKIMVGIADVDSFVPKQTPIDQHAGRETTTVYTGIHNFPMLPEELSTGVTSLLENQDRLSVVIEFAVDPQGNTKSSNVYRALVRNKAQLQYNSVGAWLEGAAGAPPKVAASTELQDQLKLQSDVAQKLKTQRFQNGALNLQTDEVHPLVLNDKVVDVVKQQKNHATELIEDFMVAANGVVA